ncbi:MAG: adenylate/guanylate cyclase domain-containing protein [Actinomycetota bacterium]
MSLKETFTSRESRVYRVMMFVDMTDSTAIKERETEAHWLTTYGYFFDLVGREIGPEPTVEYLGDGILAAYEDADAAEAINAAIRIQEKLANDNEDRIVCCRCSIGVSAGEVIAYRDPRGAGHYIGTVVDRAFRLCSHARPKAILVDKATVDTAAMNRVKAAAGKRLRKGTVEDYVGELQLVTLKGFRAPVRYYEIWWDRTRYGVASAEEGHRAMSERTSPDGPPKTAEGTAGKGNAPNPIRIKSLNDEI